MVRENWSSTTTSATMDSGFSRQPSRSRRAAAA
jgi:hypothetical protein